MELAKDLFFKEVRKCIDNENLLDMYRKYLDSSIIKIESIKYAVDNCTKFEKCKNIVESCHALFIASQEMIDVLAFKDIEVYEERDIEIVSCCTFYSSVNMIFISNLEENIAEFLCEIYEDLNLKLNFPREDEEEKNKEFTDIKRNYYCQFYVILKMLELEVPINEYDFAVLYYNFKSGSREIPLFISDKTSIKNIIFVNSLEKIDEIIEDEKTREILKIALE